MGLCYVIFFFFVIRWMFRTHSRINGWTTELGTVVLDPLFNLYTGEVVHVAKRVNLLWALIWSALSDSVSSIQPIPRIKGGYYCIALSMTQCSLQFTVSKLLPTCVHSDLNVSFSISPPLFRFSIFATVHIWFPLDFHWSSNFCPPDSPLTKLHLWLSRVNNTPVFRCFFSARDYSSSSKVQISSVCLVPYLSKMKLVL